MKKKNITSETMFRLVKDLNDLFTKNFRVEQKKVKEILKQREIPCINYLLPELEKTVFSKEKRGITNFYVRRLNTIEPANIWSCIKNADQVIKKYNASRKALVKDAKQKEKQIPVLQVTVTKHLSLSSFIMELDKLNVCEVEYSEESLLEALKNKTLKYHRYEML